jgi:hypothetical protein
MPLAKLDSLTHHVAVAGERVDAPVVIANSLDTVLRHRLRQAPPPVEQPAAVARLIGDVPKETGHV